MYVYVLLEDQRLTLTPRPPRGNVMFPYAGPDNLIFHLIKDLSAGQALARRDKILISTGLLRILSIRSLID